MDEDLRNALQSLGWSQQRLADWLSAQCGEKITLWRVQSWMAGRLSSQKRACPGWPLALLRAHGLIN